MGGLASLFVLASLLVAPGPAWGGLYNSCERDQGPFLPDWFSGFRGIWQDYRSINAVWDVDPSDWTIREQSYESTTRQRYVLVWLIYQKMRPTIGLGREMTELEKLSLSECLIRRGDDKSLRDAKKMLEEIVVPLRIRKEGTGRNFLMMCNYATACQQLAELSKGSQKEGEYFEAEKYLENALDMWPGTWEELHKNDKKQWDTLREWFRWSHEGEGNFNPYYRCRTGEVYFLKLIKSRKREKKSAADYEIDSLFTDSTDIRRAVRYVDTMGEFAPGKLAEAEQMLLPEHSIDEAISIVQQLLFWIPNDRRLRRQLGELYNARGTPKDLKAAVEIFGELVKQLENELKKGLVKEESGGADLKKRYKMLQDFKIPKEDPNAGFPEDVKKNVANVTSDKKDETVSWQSIVGASLGFGIAIGIVGLWQVQEIMRRMRRTKPVPPAPPAAAPSENPAAPEPPKNSPG